MSDQNKSLLLVKSQQLLAPEQFNRLKSYLDPIAKTLGCEVLLVDGGLDAGIVSDIAPLVSAISAQTKAMSELVQSNQQVIALLTEVVASLDTGDGDVDAIPNSYLDGSPINASGAHR